MSTEQATTLAPIVAFIEARIAEDEAAANDLGHTHWIDDGTWWLEGVEHSVVGPDEVAYTHPGYVQHIARHDPARVLAQVAALRAIVALHREGEPWCKCGVWDTTVHGETGYDEPCPTLRHVAAIWASHAEWDGAWA